jgi:predicted DNA binding CopG/RHH family protein
LGLVIGGKERKSMKKKIQYTDGPIGDIKIIKDFLPPPDKLVFKKKNIKVTMALDAESVDFFKKIAQRNHVPYQVMIRNLINTYVAKYQVN